LQQPKCKKIARRSFCFFPFAVSLLWWVASVAKAALGKGLGNLMKDTKGPVSFDASSRRPPNLSPGMASLLNHYGEPERHSPSAPTTSPVLIEIGKISLVAADILLCVMAMYIKFGSSSPLGAFGILVCVLALLLGAVLSCVAIWL
jgi:hypothetical protein